MYLICYGAFELFGTHLTHFDPEIALKWVENVCVMSGL